MNSDPNAVPAVAAPADRLLDLVGEALDLPPDERAAFLAGACQGDATLLAEASSLVEHGQNTGEFLGRPAYALAAGEDLGGLEAGTLRPGEMLGECRVLSLLGEGGMGEVHLAEDTKLERRVAVKLLKRRLDDASLARRFRHERKVLAALTHPNIARLYGGGTTPEGRSYLIMEYVEGERLDRFCDTRRLGVTERLALFRKVCAAVAYAHQNLVVHRDLKPANIRVTPEGEPKLLDFGIAKLLDPEDGTGPHADPTATLPGAMTPEYASPEQLRGETITTVSDVYSLGVVLYELLCGQRPYAALKSRRPDELARAICEEEPPRPSTVASRPPTTTATATVPAGQTPVTREPSARLRRLLAGDLDNIVAKALRKEPVRRYPSVLALSEDIRRHAEGLPVTARKDTLAYRAGKFVRRNTVGVVAAVLIILALLGGLATTVWQARIAKQERDRAQLAQRKAETAQRTAQTSQKQAQQTSDFLQQIIFQASPMDGGGKDVKITQVLDKIGATMEKELASEPEVLAQMHSTLGRTYMALGMNQQGGQQLRQAVEQMRRLYGEDDAHTLSAEFNLAQQLGSIYHFDEAVPLLRRIAGWYSRYPKADEKLLINTYMTLGFDLCQMDQLAEAEQVTNEALTRCAKAFGDDSMRYALCLSSRGQIERRQKRFDAAAADFRRELDILDRQAPDQTNVVITGFNLCNILFDQGKFAEAETLLERTKQDCRRILGDKENFFSDGLAFYLLALDFARHDFSKVAAEGRHTLDRQVANFPGSHSIVVSMRYMLGISLTQTGRAAEGEPLLRQALADYKPGGDAFFFLFGNIETALGDCLLAQKRYIEAEPLLLTGYDKLKQDLNKQPVEINQAVTRLHGLYIAWNKPAEAARYAATSQDFPASPAR